MKAAKACALHKELWGALLLLGVLGVSFYLFNLRIDWLTGQDVRRQLVEAAENNVQVTRYMFGNDIQALNNIAAYWKNSGKLDSPESLAYLRASGATSGFLRVAADLPSGESYTSDGGHVNVSDMGYLERVLAGEAILTDLQISKMEQNPAFAVVVPIYQNGQTIGALRGVYMQDMLQDLVNLKVFGGDGSINIISKDGDFVMKSKQSILIYPEANLIAAFERAEFREGYGIDMFRDRLAREERGFTAYQLEGVEYYAYYMPVEMGDWYIFSVVPSKYLLYQKNMIDIAAMILFAVLCGIFAFLLGFILRQNKNTHMILRKDRDYFERVLNNIPLPVFIIGHDRLLNFVNDAAYQLFKCGAEVIGKACHQFNTCICGTPNCAIERVEHESSRQTFYEMDGRSYQVTTAILDNEVREAVEYIEVVQDVTEILQAQKTLEEKTRLLQISDERYRVAMENTDDIIIDYDIAARTMFHSFKAQEIYGVAVLVEDAPESLLVNDMIHDDSKADLVRLFAQVRAGVPKCSTTLRTKTSDGRALWSRMTLTTVFDTDGMPVRAIGIVEDITREKEAELQYKRETRYLELTGPNVLLYYEADLTMHRFVSGHKIIVGQFAGEETDDFDDVIRLLLDHMVYEQDREMVDSHISWEALMRNYEAGITQTTFEYRRVVSGVTAWAECVLFVFHDEETGTLRVVGCIKDIDKAKARELEYQQKAERDLFTGLYNKVTAEYLIRKFTEIHADGKISGVFMLIDLDNFKRINDSMGHDFGDAVLKEISQRLWDMFSGTGIVGRLGGDEFVVFIPLEEGRQAQDQAQRICDMFHSAYIGEAQYKVSGSIGVAVYPLHGNTFLELYKKADLSLYHSKNQGKDIFSIFSVDMQG